MLTLLLSFVCTGNPLYLYAETNSFYHEWSAPPQNDAFTYLYALFPFGFGTGTTSMSFLGTPYEISSYLFGYYFYIAVLFGAFLLLTSARKLLVPAAWILSSLLYLTFGTMSMTHYIQIPFQQRYALLFVPAVALLISFGAFEALSRSEKKTRSVKAGAYAIVIVLLAFLITNALYSAYFITDIEQYNFAPVRQITSFLSLVQGRIYQQLDPVEVHMGIMSEYALNISGAFTPTPGLPCLGLPSNTYVVAGENATIDACAEIVFRPAMNESVLRANRLMSNVSGPSYDYSRLVVYYKRS